MGKKSEKRLLVRAHRAVEALGITPWQRKAPALDIVPKKAASSALKTRDLVTAPPIQTLAEWDVCEVLSAITEHERGRFYRSGLLWKWMQARDSGLRTVLNVRCSGLPALPFDVAPADQDKPTALMNKIAAIAKRGWYKSFPEALLKGCLRRGVGMGAVLAQIAWEARDDGYWWPRLELWPEEALRYDSVYRKWYARTMAGEVEITPGDGQWFLWEPEGSPLGFQLGAVLCLALMTLITVYDWSDWISFNSNVARPIWKVHVPRGGTDKEKNTLLSNLALLGRKTKALLLAKNLDGSGFDFELVESKNMAVDTFQKSITAANAEKAKVILGQTLTTEPGKSGSYSLGQVHQLILGMVLTADAEGLSTAIREQILTWWALYNFDDRDLAPWPEWQHAQPEDSKAKSETLLTQAQAIGLIQGQLKGSGKAVDVEQFWDENGIPLIDEEEEPEPPTPPQPPPPPPADGEEQPDTDKAEETPAEDDKEKAAA